MCSKILCSIESTRGYQFLPGELAWELIELLPQLGVMNIKNPSPRTGKAVRGMQTSWSSCGMIEARP